MELALERFSYRFAEGILDQKAEIKREIEEILLRPGSNILTFSSGQYVEKVSREFGEKGWERKPTYVDARGDLSQVMDFRKERVGVIFALSRTSSPKDVLGFQTARLSEDTEVDVGVFIVASASLQRQLEKAGKLWEGPDFEAARKGLSMAEYGSAMTVPVYLLGLTLREASPPPLDLNALPPAVISELILSFLENRYGARVLKGVRVSGKKRVLEFDGITRIEGADVILALEADPSLSTFPSRFRSGKLGDLAAMVREYQEMAGRKVRLRLVLLGDFSGALIEQMVGKKGALPSWAGGVEVDHEAVPMAEFLAYLEKKRKELME